MIVSDDHCIVNTMGVRYITKTEGNKYSSGIANQNYFLNITYKGNNISIGYTEMIKRDKMFDKLVKAMTKRKE